MKILYDHQIFGSQKFGGISRYFVKLMSRLPADIDFSNSITVTDNVYIKSAGKSVSKGIALPEFRGKGRIVNPLNKLVSQYCLSNGKYDLFHPTYYNPYFLKSLRRPYVITVHDMIHEKFSDMFRPNDPTAGFKRETIMKADKVIAISRHTKKDLMELYGLPDEKIVVIHLGHSVVNDETASVDGLPEKFVLFVGQRGGYKNFKRFLTAFSVVNGKYPEIKLVCTGSDFKADEQDLIRSLGVEKSVSRYFVTDTQLTYLYQKAMCFVYPSLYEGFGIPILEAFAAGCPLVLSDTSCFPEIAREGGLYFDPYEVDSMADSLTKIIEDSDLRKEMVARGAEVLKNYSWDRMAVETADVYKSII